MSVNAIPSHDTRTRLAHALGYHDYPASATAEPYLSYIYKRHVGSGTLEEWLELFIEVIQHFHGGVKGSGGRNSIQTLIDRLAIAGFGNMFTDTIAGQRARIGHVEDTVMYIFGTWTTMLSSFVKQHNQSRKVVAAYELCSGGAMSALEPYANGVVGLIAGSELLPGGRWDRRQEFGHDIAAKLMMLLSSTSTSPATPMSMSLQTTNPQGFGAQPLQTSCQLYEDTDTHESLSIEATRLNAFTLNVLSAVRITWTQNVSRHMMLTKSRGRHTLELFSLPCAFEATTFDCVGLSSELAHEIKESYAMLFNAWHKSPIHVMFGSLLGIREVCWCWSCSAYRYRRKCVKHCRRSTSPSRGSRKIGQAIIQSEFDPLLIELLERPAHYDWTPDDFPKLWMRITRLEQHLQTSRPWSLWILFRDRRDTMQFWTFLFASAVVFLTVVQVVLGIAQVVGSFK